MASMTVLVEDICSTGRIRTIEGRGVRCCLDVQEGISQTEESVHLDHLDRNCYAKSGDGLEIRYSNTRNQDVMRKG
jgi:hypothetical protein